MLKIMIASATLVTTLIVQMPRVEATSIDRLPDNLALQVVIKSGGRLAQVGDRSGNHPDYSWGNSNEFGPFNQEKQRREEEQQFYYSYPERQSPGNRNNFCQGKDCNLRTFSIEFDTKLTPKIKRK